MVLGLILVGGQIEGTVTVGDQWENDRLTGATMAEITD